MLDDLVNNQDKWEGMVANMGCPCHLISDVVQDMYVKVFEMDNMEKIIHDNDKVNHFYIYLTLRSCMVDLLRKDRGYSDEPIPVLPAKEPIDMDKEIAFEKIWQKVSQEISTFGPYGAKLTNTYFKTDISIRSLADGSGISATSIYHSIKAYREYLRDTDIVEDWEDYCNEDYEIV